MWFVINVKAGMEAQAVDLLRNSPRSDGLQEVFCPMAEAEYQEGGRVVQRRLPMFDGRAFAIAPSKWELRAAMRRADGLGCLGDGGPSFEPMGAEEADFVNELAQPARRTAAMSRAVVLKGRGLTVTEGPLCGREQEILRHSGRARWAYVGAILAGKPAEARLGLRVMGGGDRRPLVAGAAGAAGESG